MPAGGAAFPWLCAIAPVGVPTEMRAILLDWVFPVRPPSAGCAGPHRENCPEVGVPSSPRDSARAVARAFAARRAGATRSGIDGKSVRLYQKKAATTR